MMRVRVRPGFGIVVGLMLTVAACGGSGSAGTSISFGTRDGFQLAAGEFGDGPRGIVLAHAGGGDRRSWDSFAKTLAGQGFHVVAFDFRGHGQSSGQPSPDRADRDVVAAVEFLLTRGATRVVLVGASMGGLACLEAAANGDLAAPVVAGIATLSAPVEFVGLKLSSNVSTILAPKLYMAAEGDGDAATAAEILLRLTSEPRSLVTYPGSATGVALLSLAAARDELARFVAGALP